MTPFNPQNTGRHTVTFCDKFQMSHKETEIATTIIIIIRRSIIKKYYYNNSPNTKQLLIFNLDLCVCYFAMIMFPQMHVDIAVCNILLTFSMTLTETDRLRAEQTSAAVSHSALPLKLFLFNLYFELCPSHHKMQTLLDIKEKIQSKYMDMDSLFYNPAQFDIQEHLFTLQHGRKASKRLDFETTRHDLHPSYHKEMLAGKCFPHSKVTREIQFITT